MGNVAAIDYSITSPAMVVLDDDIYYYYYMTKIKSRVHIGDTIYSEQIPEYTSVNRDIKDEKVNSSIARFQQIALFFLNKIRNHSVDTVFLEGYSLGSKGKVFSIAENTAILKYYLMHFDILVSIIPPTKIKKYATGKGNSGKDKMKEAFESSTNAQDLHLISHYKESPYTDCIDAYWILRYGLDI